MPNRSRMPSRSPAICSGVPTSRCGLVSTSCGVGSYRAASASATGRRLPLTSTAKTRTPQLQLAEPVTGCLADPAELAPGGLGRDAAQDQPAAVGPVRGPTAPIISGGCGRWAGTRPGGMPADLVVLPGEGERLAGEGSLEHRDSFGQAVDPLSGPVERDPRLRLIAAAPARFQVTDEAVPAILRRLTREPARYEDLLLRRGTELGGASSTWCSRRASARRALASGRRGCCHGRWVRFPAREHAPVVPGRGY